MRRTEQVQGLRLMKFEEVYGRTHRGGLSQAEAAEVLGVSERTFRRWRDRYEAEGADGLYDRRLGRLSARRAPVDEVARVLAPTRPFRYCRIGARPRSSPNTPGAIRLQIRCRRTAACRASHRRHQRAMAVQMTHNPKAYSSPTQAMRGCHDDDMCMSRSRMPQRSAASVEGEGWQQGKGMAR